LFGTPRVLDLPVNEEGLKAWVERQEHSDTLEAARAWAREYKERRRKDRGR